MIPKRFISSSFGGGLIKSHPKEKRPFSPSLALHVVFKSSQVSGGLLFTQNKDVLTQILKSQAKEFDVKIYAWQIYGPYLHFVIHTKSRKKYLSFIRAMSGLIARRLMKSERGRPANKRFWDFRPFSRIVDWTQKKRYKHINQNKYKNFNTEQISFVVTVNKMWLKLLKRKE